MLYLNTEPFVFNVDQLICLRKQLIVSKEIYHYRVLKKMEIKVEETNEVYNLSDIDKIIHN